MRFRLGPLQIVSCMFGRHYRDRTLARRNMDGAFVSRCKGCNRRMIKDTEGWRLV